MSLRSDMWGDISAAIGAAVSANLSAASAGNDLYHPIQALLLAAVVVVIVYKLHYWVERRFKLDDAVGKVVAALKAKGLTSPYLKPFVIARVNPIRFSTRTEFDFDEVIDKMIASTGKFNVERVKQEDVAKVGGAPPEEE